MNEIISLLWMSDAPDSVQVISLSHVGAATVVPRGETKARDTRSLSVI